MSSLHQKIRQLSPERLRGMRRGVEKESLRTLPGGKLAFSPHPITLGSALTHPHITTDFSEAQLELVTGAHASASAVIAELGELHQVVTQALGDERMWVSSMPCKLPADADIPLGQYGRSHIGRAKTVYRRGLGHRYGRRMQTISGIHYNWSIPGASDADYFGLIRNFRRHSFLLLLLFGASPAVGASFVAGLPHGLQPLGEHTLHLPHATSLRMGRLGYQSEAQASLRVSYNDLAGYGTALEDAMTRVYPAYEAFGLRNDHGQWQQLSTTLLQIENEFYGTIRPKRTIRSGERPLHALRERGVEYVEVRCMDLDPFCPTGISVGTARFLDVFLLHCLLSDSPPDTPEEIAALGRNQHRIAGYGRQPGLLLERAGMTQPALEWATELVQACEPIARALDEVLGGGDVHQQGVAAALAALAEPVRLPSAQVLEAMQTHHAGQHARFVMARSEAVRQHWLAEPLPVARQAHWRGLARESLLEQARIEAEAAGTFEEFMQDYLAVAGLRPVV